MDDTVQGVQDPAADSDVAAQDRQIAADSPLPQDCAAPDCGNRAHPPEPEGPLSIQAGQWWYDPRRAVFTYSKPAGVAILPGFDLASDRIDLAGRRLDFEALRARISDRAWAVEINLDGTPGTQGEDRLILKGLNPDDLTEQHFRL